MEHINLLEQDYWPKVMAHQHHTLRVTPIDPETGWCSFLICPNPYRDPGLVTVAGDDVHNLRCAIDYVVTALVDRSGAKLTPRHAFPVYLDRAEYRQTVGTPTQPLKNGPLAQVKVGAHLVEQLQPYHRGSDADSDPLWQLAVMSNADKHRELLVVLSQPGPGEIAPSHDGTVLEEWLATEIAELPSSDSELEVLRLRFAQPYPTRVQARATGSAAVVIGAKPFGKRKGVGVDMAYLRRMADHVRTVIDLFARL